MAFFLKKSRVANRPDKPVGAGRYRLFLVVVTMGLSTGSVGAEQSIAEREGLEVDERRAIFVFINIRDKADHHYTKQHVQELREHLFSEGMSVDAIYNQSSFGQTRFLEENVRTPEPITVEPYEGCPKKDYRIRAMEVLRSELGIEAYDYQHRFFIFPSGKTTKSECLFTAAGQVGSHGVESSKAAWAKVHSVFTIAHEMGHNVGFNHAKSDRNNNGFNEDEPSDRRYGDGSCIMGSTTGPKGFNSVHADQAGWYDHLPAGTLVLLNKPLVTERVLLPLGRDPYREPGTQVIKLPRKSADGEFYYLSFRESAGVDTNLKSAFVGGVSIHRGRKKGKASYLICTLKDQEIFRDAERGLVIRQLSHSRNGVRIHVEFRHL
ncbi:reprolysin-like metallopeptidase [Pontiella sulfatireligans]|uniref:Peptidase M11 gametolysin domain-containing protein n=1 Tax=Pontiella sulfatireligans TaxID=2750658 RepID=A0A6C2UGQ9_9BACT|nr:hypothetical protein [Pontiella sulfatireligans]VGO19109.1 hypothetical protein SCARR_01165 [Pontiella sulfatireligans]